MDLLSYFGVPSDLRANILLGGVVLFYLLAVVWCILVVVARSAADRVRYARKARAAVYGVGAILVLLALSVTTDSFWIYLALLTMLAIGELVVRRFATDRRTT